VEEEGEGGSVFVEGQTPLFAILHGVFGGSQESYVLQLAKRATENGFKVLAVNFRGAGTTHLKTPRAYCGAITDDVRFVFKRIAARYPRNPFFAVGFSLGSNVLVKYLGEDAEASVLTGAVSISNIFDLQLASTHVHRSLIGRHLISRSVAANACAFVKRHMNQYESLEYLDFERIFQSRRIDEFDTHATIKMFEYPSLSAYYEDASCSRVMNSIRTPLLCINALDDPFVDPAALPLIFASASSSVIFLTTQRGGHVAWIEEESRVLSCHQSWVDKVAILFFQRLLQIAHSPTLHQTDSTFIAVD